MAFSELVREMRQKVSMHAGKDGVGGDRSLTVEIALGEIQALQMSHAFFGLANEAARLNEDDNEKKVAERLAEEVGRAIRKRNDIAHGDWHVGDLILSTTGLEPANPRLVRVLAHDKDGPFRFEEYTVAQLDELTDELLRLATVVVEFGKLAFGFPSSALAGRSALASTASGISTR